MRNFLLLISFLIFVFPLYSQELTIENLPLKKNIKEKITQGFIISESKVNNLNQKKEQSLDFYIAGLHSKSCAFALKTLSQYENFSKFLSFVKESQYDERKGEINFLLSHILMPYEMRLVFKLPRITKIGSYPYRFDDGFLKNLNGEIKVMNFGEKCLFYTNAQWRGPHTGFSASVFELFSQALAKLSMEVLFRISSCLNH